MMKYLCSVSRLNLRCFKHRTLKLVDNRNDEIQFLKEHFLGHNKLGLLISGGSAATYMLLHYFGKLEVLRSNGQRYMDFVANFIIFLAVKKFEDRSSFGQVRVS